jgi:hypothetical protein
MYNKPTTTTDQLKRNALSALLMLAAVFFSAMIVAAVKPFLDVRVAVLNKTLAGSSKRLYTDFQTDNDNHAVRLAA